MNESRPWHQLFGLSLIDFFRGMPVHVELEKDLSLKKQLLDVVLIRKESAVLSCKMPDGFDDLAPHNLVSFKSYQEALDGWALDELVGHYVNYRKQVSPSMQDLLPESDFRLYAVSVRFPRGLSKRADLTAVQPGVYEVHHFTGAIRVVVIHELPQDEHNAVLHLFSAQMDLVRFGVTHYRMRSEETSTLLLQLFQRYDLEAIPMLDALEQFTKESKESIAELLHLLPPSVRLKGISPDERLKGISPDERLRGISPDERLKGISPNDRLTGLSSDELLAALAALSPEVRAALTRRLKEDGSL